MGDIELKMRFEKFGWKIVFLFIFGYFENEKENINNNKCYQGYEKQENKKEIIKGSSKNRTKPENIYTVYNIF